MGLRETLRRIYLRLAQGRGRRVLRLFIAALMIALGIYLAIISTISSLDFVAQETLNGSALPGETAIRLNRTDYGIVSLVAQNHPCPLLVHPLRESEYLLYLEEGLLPTRVVDCDHTSLTLYLQVNRLLFRNMDPTDRMNYSLELTYYQSVRPLAWVALPAFALLLPGSIILVLDMITKGIRRLSEDPRSREGPDRIGKRKKKGGRAP